MIRFTLAACTIVVAVLSTSGAEARHRHHRHYAGPHSVPYTQVPRHRAVLPPHIPYRDPAYRPVRRVSGPFYGPPVIAGFIAPRHPNAPVYNEPPPRFAPY